MSTFTKNILAPSRLFFIFLFLVASGLSLASLYFQFVMDLEPCPLCITQRIAVIALTILYFCAIFIKKRKTLIINTSLQLFFALFGAGIAGRHVWLIHHPNEANSGCMPDMSILWHYMPLQDLLKVFFSGSGSCVQAPWTWLGITMPEWTLGFFVFFIIMAGVSFLLRSSSFFTLR